VTPALGMLDLGWVEPPRTHAQVVHDTIELAPIAESFGYARYWLAEHHSHWVAHASPELLLPLLAGLTSHMRVGTAGVLLGYYSPYKVAANFRLLEALFPGRIDLGIARGRPDGNAGQVLLDGRAETGDTGAHAQRVDELLCALRGESDPPPCPLGVRPPEVWLLGSGRDSMRVAAQRGTSFSLALFFRQWVGPDVLEEYRAEFQPSPIQAQPRACIAVAGACGETYAEARQIMARYHNEFMLPTVVGSPSDCADQLNDLADHYRVDEVVFMDAAATLAERTRTCEMLSSAVGLAQPLAA
jgi:luciferase family oxidoreductase group 1